MNKTFDSEKHFSKEQFLIEICNSLFPAKNKISIKDPDHSRHSKTVYAEQLKKNNLNNEILENWNENV